MNLHKKIMIIMFVVIILSFPIATFVFMPKEDTAFSENENKFLARLVPPTGSSIAAGRFMTGFDEWFADRFMFREELIRLQNQLERLQGKTEINGVFTVDNRMILSWRGKDSTDEELPDLDETLKSIDSFSERLSQTGTESYIMLIPSSQEIYMDLLPANSHVGSQSALIKHCYDSLENLTSIDVMTYLSENSDSYIYYRTDHHWTTFGAYWGYFAASKRLAVTPYDLGWFDVEHVSSDFRGTLFSKTLNFSVTPDVVSFYTLANSPPRVNLTINNGSETTEHDSLYFREFLTQKDKYAAFMGHNVPIMKITTDVESDKSLLVFKDSFANCMLPFLANHYNKITVLDMRYINTDISELVELSEYEQVLFVYGAVEFSQDTGLRKLNLTKN
jgi:hypothetical protein